MDGSIVVKEISFHCGCLVLLLRRQRGTNHTRGVFREQEQQILIICMFMNKEDLHSNVLQSDWVKRWMNEWIIDWGLIISFISKDKAASRSNLKLWPQNYDNAFFEDTFQSSSFIAFLDRSIGSQQFCKFKHWKSQKIRGDNNNMPTKKLTIPVGQGEIINTGDYIRTS